MRIRAFGGLANRLRVVMSYRQTFGPLEIVWRPDGEIAHGRFLDVFEPIDGVTFLDEGNCGTKTLDPYPHATGGWRFLYRDLKLRPEHAERVKAIREWSPYAAMHVRRTDHVRMAQSLGGYTDDAAFFLWMAKRETPVFLATDNASTQAEFLKTATDLRVSMLSAGPIEHDSCEGGHRNTDLARCAIDLYACVHSKEFKGSGESSFTNLVIAMKELECVGY